MLVEVKLWQVQCEDCGRSPGEPKSFNEAIQDARWQSWASWSDDRGMYYWVCPGCWARRAEGEGLRTKKKETDGDKD